jgi:hypothetical protein
LLTGEGWSKQLSGGASNLGFLGCVPFQEETTMSDQSNTEHQVESKTPAEIQQEQTELDRVANEAAEQAGKTERRFDRGHDIFTK